MRKLYQFVWSLFLIYLIAMHPPQNLLYTDGLQIPSQQKITTESQDHNQTSPPSPNQSSQNDQGVPINLLYDLLGIPVRHYNTSAKLLVIGGLFPENYTQRFRGRLVVQNFEEFSTQAPGNDTEIQGILDYTMNENFSLFSNLQMTWVGVSFPTIPTNSTYRYQIMAYINNLEFSDYAGVLVLGNYEGNPRDALSWKLSTFNTLSKFVVSYGAVKQTGGTMLAPSSNPNIISVTGLKLSNEGLTSYSNLSTFSPDLTTTAVAPNNFEKVGIDFAIPGETMLLTNTSLKYPSSEVRVYTSKYFPVVTFALGLLTMKKDPTLKFQMASQIKFVVDHSIPLSLKPTSIGYGIPVFSSDRNQTRYFRYFKLDPFQTSDVLKVTSGQVISPVIEVVPYYDSITLDTIEVTYQNHVLIYHSNLAAQKVFVDTVSQQFDGLPLSWILPEIITPSFSINGIPDKSQFSIAFYFEFNGQAVNKTFTAQIDNSRKLLAVPTYMEHDGLYDRDVITGRFYPTFQALHDQGWSFSFIRQQSILRQETQAIQQDCILIIDPELMNSSDGMLLTNYVRAGGNVLVMPDYQDPFGFRSNSTNPLEQYSNPSPVMFSWLLSLGINLEVWNHTSYPTLLMTREANSIQQASPFYYVTWDSNISYFDNLELIPFRGYQVAKNSYLTTAVSSELQSFYPFALSTLNKGHVGVMGSISPLISQFSDIGVDMPAINNVPWLSQLISYSSGRSATFSAKLKDNNPKSGLLQITIQAKRLFTTEEPRWSIAITGKDIFNKTIKLKELKDTTIVFPKIGFKGSSSLTVSLEFNNHSVETVSLSFKIATSFEVLIVVNTIWAIIVLIGYFLYRKRKRIHQVINM